MPTLHLAWTVDDGPTKFEGEMMKVFESAGAKPIPVTWYIQLDRLLASPGALEKYKKLVDKNGHEIGLHGVSATANHIKWFPSTDKDENPSYRTVEEAVEGITNFQKYLNEKGISVKFVRAPTGLVSELESYLKKLGYTGVPKQDLVETDNKLKELEKKIAGFNVDLKKAPSAERSALQDKLREAKREQECLKDFRFEQACKPIPGQQARSIIDAKTCGKKDPTVEKVALDYQTLLKGLERQKLKLWGGDASGKVSPQSWEAESAGVKQRTDDAQERIKGVITGTLAKGKRNSASFVILCHSTFHEDVLKVRKDIASIESTARENKVEIKYHTMSSLYKEIVGVAP
jgi:hypothetical protein